MSWGVSNFLAAVRVIRGKLSTFGPGKIAHLLCGKNIK